MSTKARVLAKLSAWARDKGLSLDSKGYLPSWRENLHGPLSQGAHKAFLKGSGNELHDVPGRAAKMRAAHSSSALVVNVFDYWAGSPDRVLSALALPAGGERVTFEAQFETGLKGNPPNLDICVECTDGRLIGVESKFTEWLTPKAAAKEPFKPKYFPDDRRLWADQGLHGAQHLAEGIRSGEKHFRYLDVPQLLKHALGLATTGSPFELYYLYYDVDGGEAALHRAEIHEFDAAVSGDFPFHVGTYQEVYGRIRGQAAEADAAYVAYLDARYFA